jgi:hypothetical protein
MWGNWKEDVIDFLGDDAIDPKNLIRKLEPEFESIPKEDKGALALILAYSYLLLEKNEKLSYWFERYDRDFFSSDDELDFLSYKRKKRRGKILKFRDAYKKRFPVVYKMYMVESPSKSETEIGLKTIKYFKLPYPPQIFVNMDISFSCDYEIYDPNKHLLEKGRLNKGKNIISFPINSDFLKGNINNESFFKLSLYNDQYRNQKKVVFILDYKYPGNVKFDPKTGKIELIGQDIRFTYTPEIKYHSKLDFDNDQFKKYVLPNIAAGVGLFLLNSLAVNKLYDSPDSSPGLRANLDGSRIVINVFSIGFGLKGLYNLLTKKVFYKKRVYKTIYKSQEERQTQYEKQINSIKEQIFVLIRLKPLKEL